MHRQCQITCSNPFWVSHSKGGAQLLYLCMKGVRCTCRRFLHTGLEQPCAYTPGAVEQHSGCRTGSDLSHLCQVKCQPHTAPKSHSGPRNIQKLPHHIRYWIIAHENTHTEPRCKSSVNHTHSQNPTESAAIMAGSSELTDMSAQTRTNMSARAVQAAAEQAFAAAAVTRYNTHHAAAATAAATESRAAAAAAAITAAADGAKHRGDGHYTTTCCCCRTGSRVVSYRSWPL